MNLLKIKTPVFTVSKQYFLHFSTFLDTNVKGFSKKRNQMTKCLRIIEIENLPWEYLKKTLLKLLSAHKSLL